MDEGPGTNGCNRGRNGVALLAICRRCFRLCSGLVPRGLCSACYRTPGVRAFYAAADDNRGDTGRRGGGIEYPRGDRSLWPSTAAPPGSEEKLRVMEDRVAKGLPIFHPDDAAFDQHCDQ